MSERIAGTPTDATGPAIPDGESGGHVRRARIEETAQLARVLARAFEDDPVFAFVFPDESTRLRGIEHLHRRVSVPDALGDDECYTTTDLAGVALWTQVGKGRMGLVDNLRLAPTVARIFGRHTARAFRVFSYLDSHYPEQPHAHLMFLGTEPERQGQGIGSRLLRRTLSGLDQIGAPAYLEATTLRNRALYLGHGFVDLGQLNLPGGGPPLWRMWRDPA